eukprot:Pgem_evm1s15430
MKSTVTPISGQVQLQIPPLPTHPLTLISGQIPPTYLDVTYLLFFKKRSLMLNTSDWDMVGGVRTLMAKFFDRGT